MSIARKHPIANWLLLPPHEQRKALDKVLAFRDQSDDPMASGLPPAAVAWFWQEELPRLMQRPEVRRQAEEHLAELQYQGDELHQQINTRAGDLLERLDAIEAQVHQLQEVLS